jgi:hypothetical protein
MRFMLMHKVTAELERGEPPTPEVMAEIGQMMSSPEFQAAMRGGDGLRPTAHRLHVHYAGGVRTVTPGPFAAPRELIEGFATLTVRTPDEALACCDRLAAALGDGALYLGLVVEAWDLGFVARPAAPPLRYLAMHQLDPSRDGDEAAAAARRARLAPVLAALTAEGLVSTTGALASTRRGARIRFTDGRPTVIDGPFAESKELISGYTIVELPSKQVAIEWATRFAVVVRVDEIDVRELA